jgi:hypothetical protein
MAEEPQPPLQLPTFRLKSAELAELSISPSMQGKPFARVERRRGVWMVVTPDDVRALFGEKRVYDKVYRGRRCFKDSAIGRWRIRSAEEVWTKETFWGLVTD